MTDWECLGCLALPFSCLLFILSEPPAHEIMTLILRMGHSPLILSGNNSRVEELGFIELCDN